MYRQPTMNYFLFNVIEASYYLIWWIIADNYPKLMNMCEKMAALVCGCSLMKGHDVRLKRSTFWSKCCTRCDLSTFEDPRHIVMQCPFYEESRRAMHADIGSLENEDIDNLMGEGDVYNILMGKQPENISVETMIKMWIISGKHITRMYDSVIIRE